MINAYLHRGDLDVSVIGRGFAWLDTGTYDSLLEAGHFVNAIESRQGLKVACLEEIGFRNGWVSKKELLLRAQILSNTKYGAYLNELANKD